MIKIIESVNTYDSQIQEVLNNVTKSLSKKVKVEYIDKTLTPDEISVDFVWENEPYVEEYIGTWEISLNKNDIQDYSKYLQDIADDIKAAYSFIEEYKNSTLVA